MFEAINKRRKEGEKMKIRISGYFHFTDDSDCCCENGDLSILYEVPESWCKWNNDKKEQWLNKNYDKINRYMCDSMHVVASIPDVEDIEEF